MPMYRFMVEYYYEDGRNPDCHPDFFDCRDDAEREGKEFMVACCRFC